MTSFGIVPAMEDCGDRLLTIPEVAERLRVSPSQAWSLVDAGRLPYLDVGLGQHRRRLRVREVDLEAFKHRTTTATPAVVTTSISRQSTASYF